MVPAPAIVLLTLLNVAPLPAENNLIVSARRQRDLAAAAQHHRAGDREGRRTRASQCRDQATIGDAAGKRERAAFVDVNDRARCYRRTTEQTVDDIDLTARLGLQLAAQNRAAAVKYNMRAVAARQDGASVGYAAENPDNCAAAQRFDSVGVGDHAADDRAQRGVGFDDPRVTDHGAGVDRHAGDDTAFGNKHVAAVVDDCSTCRPAGENCQSPGAVDRGADGLARGEDPLRAAAFDEIAGLGAGNRFGAAQQAANRFLIRLC